MKDEVDYNNPQVFLDYFETIMDYWVPKMYSDENQVVHLILRRTIVDGKLWSEISLEDFILKARISTIGEVKHVLGRLVDNGMISIRTFDDGSEPQYSLNIDWDLKRKEIAHV